MQSEPRGGGNLMRVSVGVWDRRDSRHTSGNAHARHEVVDDGPETGSPLQRRGIGGDEAIDRHEDDEDNIEPVDMVVPVGTGDGLVGDVLFLGGRGAGGRGGVGWRLRGVLGRRRHDGGGGGRRERREEGEEGEEGERERTTKTKRIDLGRNEDGDVIDG
jgi:hypothetical protein